MFSRYLDIINSATVLGFSLVEVVLILLIVITVFMQLYYYLGIYYKVSTHRHSNRVSELSDSPPVTVVVVVKDDFDYLENYLPLLLKQDYYEYEVVVVDDCSHNAEDIANILAEMSRQYPNLRYTSIKQDRLYAHSHKSALNIGIKAARYDAVLFITTDSYPTNDKWLSVMAKGFCGATVVLGYCGIEEKKGFVNRFIRCDRAFSCMRSLASAIRGNAYKGQSQNMGYSKELYFSHRGFNYKKLNVGEDDLFIQQISQPYNTGVIVHPVATVRQIGLDTVAKWWNNRRYTTYTYKYYPSKIKRYIVCEMISRLLFFVSVLFLLQTQLLPLMIGAGALLIIRIVSVLISFRAACKRMGEKKIWGFVVIYDLVSPFVELICWISRNVKPSKGLWKNM